MNFDKEAKCKNKMDLCEGIIKMNFMKNNKNI